MLSVVFPVYNVGRYLERCMASLDAQTLIPDDVIFVNDGSTDNSGELLVRYAKSSKVRILFQRNKGVSAARNRGMAMARGDFLYFQDPDDYLHPQALELACRALRESNAAFVVFDYSSVSEEAHPANGPNYAAPVYERWDTPFVDFSKSPSRCPSVWRFLYRRASLGSLRFEECLVHEEDFYFTYLYLLRVAKGCYLRLPLYFYVQTPSSLSRHPVDLATLRCYAWVMRHLAAECRGKPWAKRWLDLTLVTFSFKHLRKQVMPRGGENADKTLVEAFKAMFGALMAEGVVTTRGFSLRWKIWLLWQRIARHPSPFTGFPTPNDSL